VQDFLNNYILQFPKAFQFSSGNAIDEAVKTFSNDHKTTFQAIKRTVIAIVGGIEQFLAAIPWLVLVILVGVLAWRLTKKWHMGLLYGALLTFVGCCGLWDEMLQTISIVVAAVLLCLLLGFPLGILLAMSKRANKFLRPVLDTMQTMPSWVYLIPAVMLFSVGTTPALLATTVYAIVPMVRMTSHGLIYVDAEMLEASAAFGSTKLQTLWKVQIPQAIPTIMTGVNQTIMLSMSMVVTCAMIGANGLGLEILLAVNRVEMGKALFPGICIVILAIILDRLTQAAVKNMEVKGNG